MAERRESSRGREAAQRAIKRADELLAKWARSDEVSVPKRIEYVEISGRRSKHGGRTKLRRERPRRAHARRTEPHRIRRR